MTEANMAATNFKPENNIIVLAVLKNVQRLINAGNEADANKQRMDQIRQTHVDYLAPVTQVSRPKLTLNRNNSYYQYYLVSLGHLPHLDREHLAGRAHQGSGEAAEGRDTETGTGQAGCGWSARPRQPSWGY